MSKVILTIALVVCCFFGLCVTATSGQNTESPCTTPNNEPGTCKLFRQCTAIAGQWSIDPPAELRSYVDKARCYKGRGVRICCAKAAEIASVDDRVGTAVVPAHLNERGFNILNSMKCGRIRNNRLANAIDASLQQFPWMALLTYDVPDDPYMCGGSLITDRYVLTAAHCKVGVLYELIGVRLGEHAISTERDCQSFGSKELCNPPVEDFGIAEAKPHPDYDRTLLINDIMLLKLDRKVIFKDHIQPICLPITQTSTALQSNQKFTITGWGKQTSGFYSDVLQYGHLNLRSNSYCADIFKRSLSDNHVCALGKDRLDNCRGDSGGPLFASVLYKTRKQFVQFGVVQFGAPGCGALSNETFPGVYANVTTQLPWITAKID